MAFEKVARDKMAEDKGNSDVDGLAFRINAMAAFEISATNVYVFENFHPASSICGFCWVSQTDDLYLFALEELLSLHFTSPYHTKPHTIPSSAS